MTIPGKPIQNRPQSAQSSQPAQVTKVTPRADRNTAPAVVQVRPIWLEEFKDDDSLQSLNQYHMVPTMRIVQALTKDDFKKPLGEGATFITPCNTDPRHSGFGEIAKMGETFKIVPVFMYPEWIEWNDRKDRGSSAINSRTLDRNSQLAQLARTKETREIPYGPRGEFKRIVAEHINFCVICYKNPMLGSSPGVISFARAEWKTGRAFANAIRMNISAPMWAQVWEFNVTQKSNELGRWYGYESRGAGFIEKSEATEFKNLYSQLKEIHASQTLQADHVDIDAEVVDGGEVGEPSQGSSPSF